MVKISQQKKIPSTPVILGIVFLILTCLYALFFIYPSYRSFSQTRQEIVEQTAKFEQLKILYPAFTKSKTLDQIQFTQRLPLPKRVAVHRNDLAKLSRKISNTAKQNQMTLSGSTFDINSLKNQSQYVSMVIKLKGKLFDFRQFLIDVIALEFFNSITNLSISTNKGQMKNFTLTLAIRIKKNPS